MLMIAVLAAPLATAEALTAEERKAQVQQAKDERKEARQNVKDAKQELRQAKQGVRQARADVWVDKCIEKGGHTEEECAEMRKDLRKKVAKERKEQRMIFVKQIVKSKMDCVNDERLTTPQEVRQCFRQNVKVMMKDHIVKKRAVKKECKAMDLVGAALVECRYRGMNNKPLVDDTSKAEKAVDEANTDATEETDQSASDDSAENTTTGESTDDEETETSSSVSISGSSSNSTSQTTSAETNDMATFATCVTDAGATFYGVEWCQHCTTQKALFGDSISEIDYVDCDEDEETCKDKEITGYPTWIFSDESRRMGTQQLETIAEQTSCSLPNDEAADQSSALFPNTGGNPMAGYCASKSTCAEMVDCKEAKFFLSSCGVKSLDQDGDGIPCENICTE